MPSPFFSGLDGCPQEETAIRYYDANGTFIGSLPFMWPESNIGDEVTLNCPCGTDIPIAATLKLQATRSCQGDFVKQAFWEEPNDSACEKLNFQLCNLAQVSIYYVR